MSQRQYLIDPLNSSNLRERFFVGDDSGAVTTYRLNENFWHVSVKQAEKSVRDVAALEIY